MQYRLGWTKAGILLELLFALMLVACGSTVSTTAPTASAADTHTRWLAALTANDRQLLTSLAVPGEQQAIFVDQTLTRMHSYITDGAGARGGAFQSVEDRGLQPSGSEQYAFSLWRFEQSAICYRAALIQQDGTWYVREWGQLPSQACGN